MKKRRNFESSVLDAKLCLFGIVAELNLREFRVRSQENPGKVEIIYGRSPEQACRIARKYFKMTRTLEVFGIAQWESRKEPGVQFSIFPADGGFCHGLNTEVEEEDEN